MSSFDINPVLPNTPTVAVIIPVYNGGENFRLCLESIAHSSIATDELIVVADGNSDGSWQIAEAFGAKILRLPVNCGPAKARNVGAEVANSDILFFVDADVTVHTNTITLVKQQFQQFPELAALIGSYDDQPGATNFLSQYKNLFHHYTHQISSDVASTFWGACGAVRRSAFIAVGGFNEACRNRVEDIELGYRLKQHSYAIRLCKAIQVKHLKRWEAFSLLRAEIFYRALPWTRLILQHRQLQADLNLSHANRLSVVMVYLLLGSLIASLWQAACLLIAIGLGLGLILVNLDVYRFFLRQRGGLFMLRVIPWHWLYFFYGGAAFAYGTVIYRLEYWYQAIFTRSKPLQKLP